MENYAVPKDHRSAQKFLGVINYYRAHIPNLAVHAASLYALLPSAKKFKWDEPCQLAFENLRKLFMERIQLSPIDLKKTFELYTDASMVAIGAVLKQGDNIIEFSPANFSQRSNVTVLMSVKLWVW
jgi:putative transposase